MAYEDELVIEAMNGYKSGERGDIFKGVYLKEELFEFERQELFEGKMSIMLPKKFTDMPLEYAKIKYPSEQRPEVIKMNELGSINFAFSMIDVDLTNQMVKEVKDGMRMLIKRVQPANVFIDSKEETIGTVSADKITEEERDIRRDSNIMNNNNLTVGWFDFKSHGIDDKLYQVMYCVPIGGKMMQGIFNSIYNDSMLWKPIVLQVIRSIQDLTKEVDSDA